MTAMEQYTSLSHGACLWNCASASPENPESRQVGIAFRAGTGGLHSAEGV